MKYRTTREADREIAHIYVSGVAEFGVNPAERYYEGLISAFELLAGHPYLARERVELSPPTRLHLYGAHLIAYIVDDMEF